MGYTRPMDARKVNVPRYSLAGPFKGHMSFKSSPYCPGSSSKLTNQYLIEDHMVSHYKKVYSAKAVVDSTVPKSLLSSVKYADQQRRERLKKDVARYERRAASMRSLSQKSNRSDTRPSSTEMDKSPTFMQRDETAYPCLGSSMISTPRFTTSFHSKQIVYPSRTDNRSLSPPHQYRSTSEFSYRSPDSQRQQSVRSCMTSTSQDGFKAFQDPAQKTYSGDLLQKHSHCFTENKPFTPRTLKTGSKSFLSQYRFYTPPRGNRRPQDSLIRTHTMEGSSPEEELDLFQEMGNEREFSDEEPHNLNHSELHIKDHKTRWKSSDRLHSSSRVSPEGMKSPLMKKVTTEEEELLYLEFIADVTNDILSRGLYSNRVLERVFDRQIEMNKHRLDEDKMRHLLEVLHKDLGGSSDSFSICAEFEEKREKQLPLSRLLHLGQEATKDHKLFTRTTFYDDSGGLENLIHSSASLPVPEDCGESSDIHGQKQGAESSEEFNTHSDPNCDLENNEEKDSVGQSKEVEDLERNLEESLFLSEETDPQGVVEEDQ